MKNMTAIIIEENRNESLKIKNVIENQYTDILINYANNNSKEVKEVINNTTYDIIILGLKTGIDYAFDILKDHPQIQEKSLILITSQQECTLQVIANTAINFMSRPINSDTIIEVIEQVKNNLQLQQDVSTISQLNNSSSKALNLLAIPSSNDIKLLKINDILYLQSEGRYTSFHTVKNKTIVSSTNIGEYQKKLIHNNFFRIHNSFLVNTDYIENVQKKNGFYIEMNNQDMIPVAKRKKEPLLQFLGIK